MCRLSILVPWWNEPSAFEDTLVSILQNCPNDSEILVVHAQRYDDPYGLRSEVRFVQCAADSELDLINTGFYRAEGDIVHVIRCGMLATPKWTESAVDQFDAEFVGAVAPLILSEHSTTAESGWNLTRNGRRERRSAGARSTSCTSPSLDAGFFRRQPVLDLGGFNTDIAAPELELGLALAHLGLDCLADDHSELQTVDDKTRDDETVDEVELARSLELLYWRDRANASSLPSKLSHLASLASDALRGKWASLRGRLDGWRHRDRESYRTRIDEVLQRIEDRAYVLAFPSSAADSGVDNSGVDNQRWAA